MDAGLLDVVTCYFNPIRFETRLRLCKEHLEHLLDTGVRPTVVECQTGERPFELPGQISEHVRHIGVRSKTLLWNKENLIKIGITRLDPDWKYVCWTDADIKFRKPDWGFQTVHALQIYDVIQPWSDAYDLGPQDQHLAAYKSFMHQWYHGHSVVYGIDPSKSAFEKRVQGITPSSLHPTQKLLNTPGQVHHDSSGRKPDHPDHPDHPDKPGKCKKCGGEYGCCECPPCPPPYYGFAPSPSIAAKIPWWKRDGGPHEYPHTGYAWAMTRAAVDATGGPFEYAATGAGDYHMALALIGFADNSMPRKTNGSYRKHLKEWEIRALHGINFNFGYLQGTIEHCWHGRKSDRRYIDRWQIALEHDFDPDHDIMRNSMGVLELTCRKPKLRHDLDVYLNQRWEDSNTL